jgi:hypothetical protein
MAEPLAFSNCFRRGARHDGGFLPNSSDGMTRGCEVAPWEGSAVALLGVLLGIVPGILTV